KRLDRGLNELREPQDLLTQFAEFAPHTDPPCATASSVLENSQRLGTEAASRRADRTGSSAHAASTRRPRVPRPAARTACRALPAPNGASPRPRWLSRPASG